MTWTVRTTIAFVLVCCTAAALIMWIFWPSPEPYVPATIAPEVVGMATQPTPAPPTIQTYAPKAKARLNLPAAVSDDDRKQVVSASRVQPDGRPHTVTTVVDLDTGDFHTYDRPEPLPWLAQADQTAIALGYVIKNTGHTWRAKARRDLVQIKQLHGYAEAQLDGDQDWSAGAFIEWRF